MARDMKTRRKIGDQPRGSAFGADNGFVVPFVAQLKGALDRLRRSEYQLSIVLSLVIGALVGLVVVAFILLTGRLAAHMYPAGGSGWRRVLVPVLGSLATGY